MKVAILDYGMGNLFSVSQALKFAGAEVIVSDDPAAILAADRVVLPGVGAFPDGMRELQSRGLDRVVHEIAGTQRPLLGICLGMQMLFDEATEFGLHAGLGLVPGRVEEIPTQNADGSVLRIPHIGWNALHSTSADWSGSIFAGIPENTAFYFVHSFAARPSGSGDQLATCDYGDHALTAAVRRGNVTGCQFHPEKSGEAGIQVLRNFLKS